MSNCTIFAKVPRTTRCGHFNTLNWFFVGQVGWELEGSTSDIAGFIVYMYTSYHLEIHIDG